MLNVQSSVTITARKIPQRQIESNNQQLDNRTVLIQKLNIQYVRRTKDVLAD